MMANEQNLKPFRTESEAREAGRRGGISSGYSRREKRLIREALEEVLNQTITNKSLLAEIKKSGLPVGDHPTYKMYLVASVIIQTAKRGRMDDLLKLMAIIGEQTGENLDALDKARELLANIPSAIS